MGRKPVGFRSDSLGPCGCLRGAEAVHSALGCVLRRNGKIRESLELLGLWSSSISTLNDKICEKYRIYV